ncbi:MAG TPA: hypothetical protein VHD90_13425 [Phototrophicaceae bacterium]|nr:hypothetical protein [Phototrophicaceae bacterium]
MSEQANLPARLREGIDAAKRGDKITARRLLLQVLSSDANNELALMWMASVVDTLNERRFYLERALQVNPENARAREALRRLGVEQPQAAQRSAPAPSGDFTRRAPRQSTSSGTNLYLIGAAVVAIIVIAVIVASAVSSQTQPPSTQAVQLTFQALLNPTAVPTRDTRLPTSTVLPGIVVSIDPGLYTPLPPTFTPTFTLTPTVTPTPSVTPFPVSSFTMVYADIEQGASVPSLYQGQGDGSGEVKLAAGVTAGFTDVTLNSSGDQIAFVRLVVDEEHNGSLQLFVGPLNSPSEAKPITTLKDMTLEHPSWSPDGTKIVFSSDDSGTEQIEQINVDGTGLQTLTSGTARSFDPAFSPDGKQIAFVSDAASPGFNEIYVMDSDGKNVTQLTTVPNSYAPAWSPDGTKIAYVNDQSGSGDIYVMDADGQRPFLLTVDDNGAENDKPVWSPDGRWVYFTSNRDGQSTRWYAVDLQGNAMPITVAGRNPESLSFIYNH